MSPEYAMEGLFSIKSDVFSFGVLVLEIVSGKKNTSFYHSDSLNLLGHVGSFHILSFLFLPASIVFHYFPSLHTNDAAFALLYHRHGSYGILIKLWT
jgi:hypothetical protein